MLAHEHHRDRVAHFACLAPRARRDLILLAGGYRSVDVAKTHGRHL
jgi:hypothetical protein